jgi:cytochrome bd-type quinol oxidase subunit 2
MASLQPPNRRKFALLAVAFLLLAFAGVAMALGGNNVTIQSLAIVAVVTGVACLRLVNVHKPSGSATEASQRTESSWATRLRRPTGIISIILVPIMAMASFFLYRDAVQGYRQIWTVYFFAATAFICSLCWSFFVATFFGP